MKKKKKSSRRPCSSVKTPSTLALATVSLTQVVSPNRQGQTASERSGNSPKSFSGLLAESQDQNLAVPVLYVRNWLESGWDMHQEDASSSSSSLLSVQVLEGP